MKTLLIIILAMAPIVGSAQTFDYSASIETGYYREGRSLKGYFEESYAGIPMNNSKTVKMYHPKPSFYSDIQVGVHFFDHKINFKTNVLTTFSHRQNVNFTPLLASYTSDLYYNPALPIEIGWRHRCTHTIGAEALGWRVYNSYSDKIYVKLTIR